MTMAASSPEALLWAPLGVDQWGLPVPAAVAPVDFLPVQSFSVPPNPPAELRFNGDHFQSELEFDKLFDDDVMHGETPLDLAVVDAQSHAAQHQQQMLFSSSNHHNSHHINNVVVKTEPEPTFVVPAAGSCSALQGRFLSRGAARRLSLGLLALPPLPSAELDFVNFNVNVGLHTNGGTSSLSSSDTSSDTASDTSSESEFDFPHGAPGVGVVAHSSNGPWKGEAPLTTCNKQVANDSQVSAPASRSERHGRPTKKSNKRPAPSREANLLLARKKKEQKAKLIDSNGRELSNKRTALTSKFKGVCWYRRTKKWVVQVKTRGIRLHVGYFSCELKAAAAYKKALASIDAKA